MSNAGLHEQVKTEQAVAPDAYSATLTAYNGTTAALASGIDIRGFDEAMVELSIGGTLTGALDVALYDSATDDGTAATAVTDSASTAAAFAQQTGAIINDNLVIRVRAKDLKRYLFVKTTNADANSKKFGVNVLLGRADSEPVTQDQTVNFGHDVA